MSLPERRFRLEPVGPLLVSRSPGDQLTVIPNATASTSPYADHWAQLKSVHYALSRALDPKNQIGLSDLDRERLQALVEALKTVVADQAGSETFKQAGASKDSVLHPGTDLRDQIAAVPEFDAWRKTSKKGVDHNLQRLIQASETFLQSRQLFTSKVPREEFEILRAIVRSLVSASEVALHA